MKRGNKPKLDLVCMKARLKLFHHKCKHFPAILIYYEKAWNGNPRDGTRLPSELRQLSQIRFA